MSGAIHLHGPRPYLLRLLAQYPFSNEQSNSFRVMTHLSLAGVVLSGLGCHGRFISTYKIKCSENYSSLKLTNERLSKLFSFYEYLKYLNGFYTKLWLDQCRHNLKKKTCELDLLSGIMKAYNSSCYSRTG